MENPLDMSKRSVWVFWHNGQIHQLFETYDLLPHVEQEILDDRTIRTIYSWRSTGYQIEPAAAKKPVANRRVY